MNQITSNKLFKSYPWYLTTLFSGCSYPWEILSATHKYIEEIYSLCIDNGFTENAEGILVGKNVSISPLATLIAPAIIGDDTEIRPSAYIRGNVITGKGCVIGNSSEVKNSIILDYAQIPHFNYAGNTVIGNYAHMGAGAVCSNLKSDKSLVSVKTNPPINTGLIKFGAILGDNVEVGCGCVLNPGTVICPNSRIYPLTAVRGVIPANSIMKSSTIIIPIK